MSISITIVTARESGISNRGCVWTLGRCGNGGSSCVLDDFAQEGDASMSQSPEDQRECWHMTTEFGEEIAIKKTLFFRWSGRNLADCADSAPSVWKPVCGAMCEKHNVDVLFPTVQEEFVGLPVHQFLEDTVEVMKLVPQKIVEVPVPPFLNETLELQRLVPQERIVDAPVPYFREETMEVVRLVPQKTYCRCASAFLARRVCGGDEVDPTGMYRRTYR